MCQDKTDYQVKLNLQSYLIDLVKTNKDRKDGPSMCAAFAGMTDKAEQEYGCTVVCFCCAIMMVVVDQVINS